MHELAAVCRLHARSIVEFSLWKTQSPAYSSSPSSWPDSCLTWRESPFAGACHISLSLPSRALLMQNPHPSRFYLRCQPSACDGAVFLAIFPRPVFDVSFAICQKLWEASKAEELAFPQHFSSTSSASNAQPAKGKGLLAACLPVGKRKELSPRSTKCERQGRSCTNSQSV